MPTTLWRLEALGPLAPLMAAARAMDDRDDPPALAWSVFEEGASDQGRLDVLFAAMPDAAAFRAAFGLEDLSLHVSFGPLPEADWIAMSLEGLPPVEAGRFVLFGAHARDSLPEGLIPIEIEAGPAFGTGHHGTTKGCLIAADRLQKAGFEASAVLDLGCGTGALAIAAAMLWPQAEILATDIDPEAVEETGVNARKNAVAARIRAETADGFDHAAMEGAAFDLIFANILAGPLETLAADLAARLAPEGKAVLSGLLEEQIAAVEAAYRAQGLRTEARDLIDGWAILTLSRG